MRTVWRFLVLLNVSSNSVPPLPLYPTHIPTEPPLAEIGQVEAYPSVGVRVCVGVSLCVCVCWFVCMGVMVRVCVFTRMPWFGMMRGTPRVSLGLPP